MSTVEDFACSRGTCRCGEPSMFPPNDEIAEQSTLLTEQLFQDAETLKKIITRHEATIRNRWLKKGKAQRKDVLLAAWPKIPRAHRPDFDKLLEDIWEPNRTNKPGPSTSITNAYLWPHINLEDLVKSKLLLIYLNARGRHPPHVFTHFDLEMSPVGCGDRKIVWDLFPTTALAQFKDTTSPQEYIEFINCSDEAEVNARLRSGRVLHPGFGFQLLQIQQRIWSFLVKCCQHIMHDSSLEDLLDSSLPIQLDPGPLSDNTLSYTSLDNSALRAPYQVPSLPNLSRIFSLVHGQRRDAENHMWALREDPSYFADTVRSYAQHMPERVPDTYGNKHPALRKPHAVKLLNKALERMVEEAYGALIGSNDVLDLATEFQSFAQTYLTSNDPAKSLSKEFIEAFEKLLSAIENECGSLKSSLRKSLHGCPRLSGYMERSPNKCANTICDDCSSIRFMSNPMKGNSVEARLVRLLSSLLSDKDCKNYGIWPIADAVERFIQREPTAQTIFTPFVASLLARLSIVAETLRQLSLFPAVRTIIAAMDYTEEKAARNMHERHTKWCGLGCRTMNLVNPEFARLGDPEDGKFYYPIHKRRTLENVRAIRAAEANLDKYWDSIDAHYIKECGKSANEVISHLLTDGRTKQQTPPWDEEKEAGDIHIRSQQLDYIYEPLSRMYHDPAQEITGSFDKISLPVSTKLKTRGFAVRDEEEANISLPDVEPEEQPTFTLDKRSHKVFRTLFHSPHSPDQPGEIPWTDFLHAMVSTGFSAEKLHGSAWNFTPTSLDVERSIQFHEPHPSSKLPFAWARRFGRRLNRAYGWKGDMFRLA